MSNPDLESLIRATLWAEKALGPENSAHKIRSIEVMRRRFGISIREGVEISRQISWTGPGYDFDNPTDSE